MNSDLFKIFGAYMLFIYQLIVLYAIINYIVLSIGLWFIFKKAGEESWKALIPFYNIYLLSKIAWNKDWKEWYIIIFFLPSIFYFFSFLLYYFTDYIVYLGNSLNSIFILFMLITSYKLSKSFGQSTAFAIGILLLPWIFIPILAFSKNKQYIGNTM